MDGNGKLQTSEHGARHPPNWKPPFVPPDVYTGYEYAGCCA